MLDQECSLGACKAAYLCYLDINLWILFCLALILSFVLLSSELTLSDDPEFLYYLSDGVFGSFVGKLLGNIIPSPSVHKVKNPDTNARTYKRIQNEPTWTGFFVSAGLLSSGFFLCLQMSLSADKPVFSSSLWGPSFDVLDQVVEHCLLPELSVGDWLIFKNMGACGHEETAVISDSEKPSMYYTISESSW